MRLFVILLLLVLIGFPAIKEVKNFVEHPSVQTYEYRRDGWEIIFYHRGTRDRRGTVLVRPSSGAKEATPVAEVNSSDGGGRPGAPSPFESICWSQDRTAVYATTRGSQPHPNPEFLWVYDLGIGRIFTLGEVDSATDEVILARHLNQVIGFKGGPGEVIAHWYELGSQEGYVHFWEAKHWDRLGEEVARP